MKVGIINSLFLVCYLLTGVVKAVATSPEAVIQGTADAVINKIDSERATLESHPKRVYQLVNEFITPNFDFNSMSKWILGKHWKSATDTQRMQFIEQFKMLMVRTYARALLEYSGQKIKYFPSEQKPNSKLAVVKTELTSSPGAQPFHIAYRMYQKDANWKVIDITVDGVSLISTYKGSFKAQVKKNGLDFLIQELISKNETLADNP